MLTTKRNLLVGLAAVALLAGAPGTGRAGFPEFHADLYPTEAEPLASGWADWDWVEIEDPHGGRTYIVPYLHVEVEEVYSTESLQVLIHPPKSETYWFVGVIHLTDGSGHLWRRYGSPSRGDEILIVDESTGTLLLWGIFE